MYAAILKNRRFLAQPSELMAGPSLQNCAKIFSRLLIKTLV
ncbi:hypothetical protein COXBURSA334_0587 [Coxiella burnetii Q321]|nr:hypothetical protein COXBURSA334_0587 [Coxiella burnetii Q321]